MKKEKIDTSKWNIAKEDFDTTFAKILRNDPNHLQSYRKKVMKEYNETRNIKAFLASLKIIAMADGNIPELAKKANIQRTNVYRLLSKDNNPAFESIVEIAHNLGMDFIIVKQDKSKAS
jgi:DNA-binding phage protein